MQLNAQTIIWRSIPTYPNVLVLMMDICEVAMNGLCAFFYIFILDFLFSFFKGECISVFGSGKLKIWQISVNLSSLFLILGNWANNDISLFYQKIIVAFF